MSIIEQAIELSIRETRTVTIDAANLTESDRADLVLAAEDWVESMDADEGTPSEYWAADWRIHVFAAGGDTDL